MEKYFELMAGAGVEVYIIIGIVLLFFIAAMVRAVMKTKRRVREPGLPRVPVEQEEEEVPQQEQKKTESVLGTGSYKCMCFRPGNILDFTTMPKPVGEIYQFETTCPNSGAGYIVMETEDGKIVNYDPRKVAFKIKQSPEIAWFARHWDIVKDVFAVPLSVWRSPSTYFAIGMIAIVFVCGLVVFD